MAASSMIRIYGAHVISLHLASKKYEWRLIVADVMRPLLGANFLHSNFLLVDLNGKCLVDDETYLSVP